MRRDVPATLLGALLGLALHVGAAEPVGLRAECPPGFEQTAAGVCALRTMYQFYDSLQGKGVGGTKTGLPPHRDGFTPQQIDLGRYLFFDPLLSGERTMSCASCHHPERGFSDSRPRSLGPHGEDVGRAAPTLWNVAFLQSFFWDARARTLEEQMTGPLYSAQEMGNTPERLLQSLNGNAEYLRLFREAFPRDPQAVTLAQVYTALAAFQTSLISLNSRYDRYALGYHEALSPREIEGMNVFRSFVARCAECHTPPLFTNQQVAVLGTPEPDGRPLDVGAEKTFNAKKLKGAFKVPTLRNVAHTAPYMHSGRFATLRETVAFYTGGRGHAIPPGVEMQPHWHIWDPKLSDEELDRLVDFLQALSDETFRPQVPAALPSGLEPVGISPLAKTSGLAETTRAPRPRGES
jgi:cytochrome c peroxidase